MANISVRKLDDEVLTGLKNQAAQHGVSMEEEARQILTRAITPTEKIGDMAVRLFTPLYNGDELEIPAREVTDPVEF